MSVTTEELKRLRDELAVKEALYIGQRRAQRQEVSEYLAAKIKQINAIVAECEKLAESADMVFYYSRGYEEYGTELKENWSESSRYC